MNDKEKLVEQLLFGVTSWNQWRQDNPNEARLDLNHVNLSGANLRGADLSEVDLTEADLSGANLSNAKLYAVNLSGANLSHANLAGAKLNGAILTKADLSGADLSCANLRFAKSLKNDRLYELYRDQYLPILQAMQRYQSFNTNLAEANLQSAKLQCAELQGVNFQQANLTDANLTGASLYCADLSGADLRGADLRKTILQYINLRNTKFSRRTKINERWRRISLLVSNQVGKPYRWEGAELRDADLQGADLSQTIMPYADLRRANLRNANLMGADFSSTYRTADVDLRGAKYNQDTILPYMSWSQKQTLIFIDSPVESDKEEEIIDLSILTDERKRINSERVSREDQPKFRELLKDAYQGKCAISQYDVERVIEAAHIFPYRGPQTDCLWNGILLRLDLHRLFDSYLLTIDAQDYRVRLSPSLMNSCYREYAEKSVCFPEQPISKNRKQVLQWHNAQCSWWKNT